MNQTTMEAVRQKSADKADESRRIMEEREQRYVQAVEAHRAGDEADPDEVFKIIEESGRTAEDFARDIDDADEAERLKKKRATRADLSRRFQVNQEESQKIEKDARDFQAKLQEREKARVVEFTKLQAELQEVNDAEARLATYRGIGIGFSTTTRRQATEAQEAATVIGNLDAEHLFDVAYESHGRRVAARDEHEAWAFFCDDIKEWPARKAGRVVEVKAR